MNNFVAAVSDTQQTWLAAVLDFEFFIYWGFSCFKYSAALSSLLSFTTILDIPVDVNIANIWHVQALFLILIFNCFP